jgi:hypothetical protein
MIFFENRDSLIESLDKNLIIAEVGVFKGDFGKKIFICNDPKKLYLIDIFTGDMISGDENGNNIETINLDIAYNNLKTYFNNFKNVEILKGYSYDALNSFGNNFFDLIYIDADHSYEGVKTDLNIAIKKIKFGGYISGHDYNNERFPGVVKAVDEFCSEHNLSIFALTKDTLPSFLIKL